MSQVASKNSSIYVNNELKTRLDFQAVVGLKLTVLIDPSIQN